MNPNVQVSCRPAPSGFSCEVVVGPDPGTTTHLVTVGPDALARLAPEDADPERLVAAAIEFLLERESRESILRRFDLPVIGRYFPEYEVEIRRRLEGGPVR